MATSLQTRWNCANESSLLLAPFFSSPLQDTESSILVFFGLLPVDGRDSLPGGTFRFCPDEDSFFFPVPFGVPNGAESRRMLKLIRRRSFGEVLANRFYVIGHASRRLEGSLFGESTLEPGSPRGEAACNTGGTFYGPYAIIFYDCNNNRRSEERFNGT